MLLVSCHGCLQADASGCLSNFSKSLILLKPISTHSVFLSHISGKDEPEPVVKLTVMMGFFLTLVAGLMPLFDDRRPILGLPGQHYWLIAIFALQTLSSLIALRWVAEKLKKHPHGDQ